jgi:hypothetical protein
MERTGDGKGGEINRSDAVSRKETLVHHTQMIHILASLDLQTFPRRPPPERMPATSQEIENNDCTHHPRHCPEPSAHTAPLRYCKNLPGGQIGRSTEQSPGLASATDAT